MSSRERAEREIKTMKMIILFIILSIFNVIGSTLRSLFTIKGNKYVASLANALYYAYYNVVLIYSVADFPLWQKCLITFGCNAIGVFIVKYGEEKAKKDKLWKIEMALPHNAHPINPDPRVISKMLEDYSIPNNYQSLGEYYIFNCYCATQAQTEYTHNICKTFNGKISAYESKTL